MPQTAIKDGDELVELPSGLPVLYRPHTHNYWSVPEGTVVEPGRKVTTTPLVGVSTVSNIFAKDALVWWGMECGIDAVRLLAASVDVARLTSEELVDAVRSAKLTCNDVRDQAAERGTMAHDALLAHFAQGRPPRLADFPADRRGYIMAGAAWLLDWRPDPIDVETVVASAAHGFAGRYDLHARFPTIGTSGRVDFKTSEKPLYDADGNLKHRPYPEHLSQVEGYEIAAVESGYGPSDFRAVVRLDSTGRYSMTESPARPAHFLGDLLAYRNRRDLKKARAVEMTVPERPAQRELAGALA